MYIHVFRRKGSLLDKCIGLIDGTNLRIQKPRSMEQRAMYNGHKLFNYLKFQGAVTPDGLMLHLYGPVEGRRHDLSMLRESNLIAHISDIIEIDGFSTTYLRYSICSSPLPDGRLSKY